MIPSFLFQTKAPQIHFHKSHCQQAKEHDSIRQKNCHDIFCQSKHKQNAEDFCRQGDETQRITQIFGYDLSVDRVHLHLYINARSEKIADCNTDKGISKNKLFLYQRACDAQLPLYRNLRRQLTVKQDAHKQAQNSQYYPCLEAAPKPDETDGIQTEYRLILLPIIPQFIHISLHLQRFIAEFPVVEHLIAERFCPVQIRHLLVQPFTLPLQNLREGNLLPNYVAYVFDGYPQSAQVSNLFQEVLINLWKGYDSFKNLSNVNTWIWKVSFNTCISCERKKKRRAVVPLTMDINLFEDKDENSKQIRLLYDRIHRLNPFDRAIVLLWLENMSYEEIGAIVGISTKNVSVRLYRIKEELKKMSNH